LTLMPHDPHGVPDWVISTATQLLLSLLLFEQEEINTINDKTTNRYFIAPDLRVMTLGAMQTLRHSMDTSFLQLDA
jgi:hypothetical protein